MKKTLQGRLHMKKLKIIALILTLLVALTGCSQSNGVDIGELQAQITSYEKEVTDIKSELESLKKSNSEYQSEITKLKSELENKKAETVVSENDIELKVVEKKNIDEDWNSGRYSDFVNFKFEVKNNTDKDIKGVQGVLDIQDMFGVSILRLNLDFTDEVIPKNSSITVTDVGLEVNQFMDEHMELYNTKLASLLFEYEVSLILFTDGTQKSNE